MLIDTNVWSELLRPRPNEGVVAMLDARNDDLYLSTIVVAEMEFGIGRAADLNLKQGLRRFLDSIIVRCDGRIVAPDLRAAKIFGVIRAQLRSTGKLIADLDLLVAAQAIAAEMPLVTRNVSDMGRTGAFIINPWEA